MNNWFTSERLQSSQLCESLRTGSRCCTSTRTSFCASSFQKTLGITHCWVSGSCEPSRGFESECRSGRSQVLCSSGQLRSSAKSFELLAGGYPQISSIILRTPEAKHCCFEERLSQSLLQNLKLSCKSKSILEFRTAVRREQNSAPLSASWFGLSRKSTSEESECSRIKLLQACLPSQSMHIRTHTRINLLLSFDSLISELKIQTQEN